MVNIEILYDFKSSAQGPRGYWARGRRACRATTCGSLLHSLVQSKRQRKALRGPLWTTSLWPAQFSTELAPLCKIYCFDGEEYTVSSCVRGRLMDVNENTLRKPSTALQEKHSTDVYVAAVLPKFEESKGIEGLHKAIWSHGKTR